MPRASTTQFPARLDDILIDDNADVELCAMSSPQGRGRNSPRQAGGRRWPSSSPSRDTRSNQPYREHLWVPPPPTLPETNPRRPVKLTTLARIVKDDETPEEAKATALFEMAIHSKEGERKYHKARLKAIKNAPDSEVPEFVQVADEYLWHYRQHRPRMYRYSYHHTDLCECRQLQIIAHTCFFPCAVQSMYDAINDPGFTPCSVPCQAALFALFPCTWPVFCCAQAYVLRSKLNLIFGVRESYHLFAKSFFCPCCLTACMHSEIELRGVPVLIGTCHDAPERVIETVLFAPDIAHMGACGELVIPLPSLNEDSGKSSKPSTLPPPMAEYGCCSLQYNSLGHALQIALSAAPYLALTFAVGPLALVYYTVKDLCGNGNTSNNNSSSQSCSSSCAECLDCSDCCDSDSDGGGCDGGGCGSCGDCSC